LHAPQGLRAAAAGQGAKRSKVQSRSNVHSTLCVTCCHAADRVHKRLRARLQRGQGLRRNVHNEGGMLLQQVREAQALSHYGAVCVQRCTASGRPRGRARPQHCKQVRGVGFLCGVRRQVWRAAGAPNAWGPASTAQYVCNAARPAALSGDPAPPAWFEQQHAMRMATRFGDLVIATGVPEGACEVRQCCSNL
jgi:hypothetical protein